MGPQVCFEIAAETEPWGILFIKGELNPKIKLDLDLNDSFCTLINKYNPHIF